MASAAAFLFFLVTKESVGGWDWRPHLSWSLYGVSDFVRGSDVGGLAASSSLLLIREGQR